MNFYTNVYYTGSTILSREYKDGKMHMVRQNFSPCVFINSTKSKAWKTLEGRGVEPIHFNNVFEMREFIDKYKNIDKFKIYGDIGVEYQYISDTYGNKFDFDSSKLVTMYLDIETTCEEGFPEVDNPTQKINVISTLVNGKKTVFCLGTFDPPDDVEAYCFSDEKDLLISFCEHMAHVKPDIISGWRIRFFDIPYIVNRCYKLLDENIVKTISPWRIIKQKKVKDRNDKDQTTYELIGISTLDYYDLYQSFTFTNRESYALNYIAQVELGKKKLDYSEYGSIREFYTQNFQKFVEYNIIDTVLVFELEEKLKLIDLSITLAYSAGINFVDVLSQVRTWDAIIYNDLKTRKIVIPPRKVFNKDSQFTGAYVKSPLLGMHEWIISYDVNSLYPSLIMHLNISPETLEKHNFIGKMNINDIIQNKKSSETFKYMDNAKEIGCSIAANGTMYSKDKIGFLPGLMIDLYKERKRNKDLAIESKKKLEIVKQEMKRRGLVSS
jgi:DNA polymerase elongation subunit (family B)